MKAKTIRILIIVALLVLVGSVAVYYINTTGDTQDNKPLETKAQNGDSNANASALQDSTTQNSGLDESQDSNMLESADNPSDLQDFKTQDSQNLDSTTQDFKTDGTAMQRSDNIESNHKSNKTQAHTSNQKPITNKTESRSNNPKNSPNKTHKDSIAKTTTKDKREFSKDTQDTNTITDDDEADESTTDEDQTDSTNLAESSTTQDALHDNTPNDEAINDDANRNKDEETIQTDSNLTDTKDNQASNEDTESETTETTHEDSNQPHDTLAQNEIDSTNPQDEDPINTENTQNNTKDTETSGKGSMNNQDKTNQTQLRESTATGACIAALSCNNSEITRRFAATSLDLHASVRAKEEARLKGQSAGDEFMRLWKQTRGTILPKLTSHVSNIYEQDSQVDRDARICVANYYTEVLEDFGNGWKDKKGDKSPMYQVTYQISCKDSNTPKLTILNETQTQGKKTAFVRSIETQRKPQGRTPPMCDSDLVYKQFAQAGFYQHAMVRAQEEGRRNGTEAQQRFMQLWDKTKAQITTKLTAHISNIEDKGIQTKTQNRTCVANYYTEVLEDFGNGWKDKKGDKSPYYLVYYTVMYANNEDDSIIIDITAQNRIKTRK